MLFKLRSCNSEPSGRIVQKRDNNLEKKKVASDVTRVINLKETACNNKVMTIHTSIGRLNKIETLIDTGASASFGSYSFLEKVATSDFPIQIENREITLKLVNNDTTSTKGVVKLSLKIGQKEVEVQLFLVEELAYPIILGCDFLVKYGATLKFSDGKKEIILPELAQPRILKPNLCMLETIEVPPFSQCFVECSIGPGIEIDCKYFFEADNE